MGVVRVRLHDEQILDVLRKWKTFALFLLRRFLVIGSKVRPRVYVMPAVAAVPFWMELGRGVVMVSVLDSRALPSYQIVLIRRGRGLRRGGRRGVGRGHGRGSVWTAFGRWMILVEMSMRRGGREAVGEGDYVF